MQEQVLDSMDLERERGITIKAQSVALDYTARDGQTYRLNMIDTPGHVDFSYEVSRSLTACEGALLVVDVSQGVQAQTVANCYTASELHLTILPVLNKIDLPSADPERVIDEIEDIIGLDATDAVRASAKTGIGITDILEAIVRDIPPPKGAATAPLRALIIDSWFDNYLGTVSLVRVMDGRLKPKDKIRLYGDRPRLFRGAGRCVHAEEAAGGRTRGGRESVTSSPASRMYAARASATRLRTPTNQRTSHCPASRKSNRACSPGFIRSRRTNTSRSATRSPSCNSTTPRCTTNPRPRRRSASASVAASSVCCTWRSSRNGSSANTVSTSSPPRRQWCTR